MEKVVESRLGRIQSPNVAWSGFRAELNAKNGDTITITDVTAKDNGSDREFVFNLIYD